MERAVLNRSCGTAASSSGRQAVLHVVQPQTFLSSRSRPCKRRSLTCFAAVEGRLVHSRFPGFFDDDEPEAPESNIITPSSSSWGLSTSQMRALGITNETEVKKNIDPVSFPTCFHTNAQLQRGNRRL